MTDLVDGNSSHSKNSWEQQYEFTIYYTYTVPFLYPTTHTVLPATIPAHFLLSKQVVNILEATST